MPPVLEFEHVSKEYRSWLGPRRVIQALADFCLRVEAGEIFGFLGPNGAGKSTAIHLAMGFMHVTSGRGQMLGRPFGDVASRQRVGFLAENVALYHRPAEHLVRFYGALNRLRGDDLTRRTHEVIEILGIAEDARRNVRQFSRGMLQRVGLAQALVNDPELLILDEPTSALDPQARVLVRELLLRRRDAGKTIFLSSHLLSEVELICDRIAVLNHGKLARLGRTSDLLESKEENEIVARGIPTDSFVGAAVNDGVVRFAVPAAAQRSALERVWALGGEVVSVNPVRRSLEELFLEVTSSKPQAGQEKDREGA
ncbi:MAG TPA: ABC transporter ATP-binding protein [Terriglobales bacterium]|nr:ABC transporter ATP-binding protein [Terriglobales bacterium]